jgi:hypothetical protein
MEQGSLEQGSKGGWVGTFLASAGLFLVLYVATLLFGHKLVYWLAH